MTERPTDQRDDSGIIPLANYGYHISKWFAESEYAYPWHDRYLKGLKRPFSRGSLLKADRWFTVLYERYKERVRQFFTMHDDMEVWKPRRYEDLYFYKEILPPAMFIAFHELPYKYKKKIRAGKLVRPTSAIRIAIERDLLDGDTSESVEGVNVVPYEDDPYDGQENDFEYNFGTNGFDIEKAHRAVINAYERPAQEENLDPATPSEVRAEFDENTNIQFLDDFRSLSLDKQQAYLELLLPGSLEPKERVKKHRLVNKIKKNYKIPENYRPGKEKEHALPVYKSAFWENFSKRCKEAQSLCPVVYASANNGPKIAAADYWHDWHNKYHSGPYESCPFCNK